MKLEFEAGQTLEGEKAITIDILRKGLPVGIIYLQKEYYDKLPKFTKIEVIS